MRAWLSRNSEIRSCLSHFHTVSGRWRKQAFIALKEDAPPGSVPLTLFGTSCV